ncbi:MAG: DUF3592 domain-containing protein [Ruminococcus sp.]|nr:DUF3592 domain-containing protein [Ruminococcus sp.]
MYKNKVTVRSTKQLNPKFIPVFFIIFAIIFMSVGITTLFYPKIKEKKCSETVTAEVIDNSAESFTSGRSGRHHRHTSTVYRPTFSFTYEGNEYIVESKTASNPPAFHKGEIVELRINPDNPTDFYAPSDKTTKLIGIIFAGIGAVFLIIGIAMNVVFRGNERGNEK